MTKLMDITFGDWLLARMRERSLSQSEFSRRAGLTRQAISYYTTGKSKQPDEFALQKIAAALQVPPEEVYRAAGIPLSKTSENPIIKQITYLTSDLPEAEQKDILELERQRQRIQKGYDERIYTAGEARHKIATLDKQITALKNKDLTTARRRLQTEDFNLTLQQTRLILNHLPQWFATEDPRIVNTLLHRLCTRIYITPDNTALPEFRTP